MVVLAIGGIASLSVCGFRGTGSASNEGIGGSVACTRGTNLFTVWFGPSSHISNANVGMEG